MFFTWVIQNPLQVEDKITELTDLWYRYVSKDHHKDCDCHWYISRKWSYGDSPVWEVQHVGYIFDGETLEAESYDVALLMLLNMIEKALYKQYMSCKRLLEKEEEYDSFQVKQAKFLLSRIKGDTLKDVREYLTTKDTK